MPSSLNGKSSGDAKLDEQCDRWLRWDGNEQSRKIVTGWIENGEWETLRSRMLNRLEFGTAGLRGVMRPGFDSMNDLVIVQTAQGLCQYIKAQFADEKEQLRFVLGYDGRYNSRRFAELSASVFIHNGFKVYLYGRMVATPYVPFAITQKKCVAGVMVTASHNPKEDNGYKVYWANGAQIIPPHDKGIQDSILENLEPEESSWQTDLLKTYSSDVLEDPFDEMFQSYYDAMLKFVPRRFQDINGQSKLKFVYTAMHGVGYPYVYEGFRVASLQPDERLVAVEEQKEADPDFPTVKFPNPEEGKSALKLSTDAANAKGINVILANDPDADRLALAVKDETSNDEWKVFNGNELGALLGWWVVHNYKELHPDVKLSDCYLLASTVSSKILRSMARIDGLQFEETLTGFKWMGNRAIELLQQGKQVLFAFEEAIGYMFSTNVLDKDGVSAACHLATMASYVADVEGQSLIQKLDQIYDTYGYHCTKCSYLFCYDKELIKRIFNRLRKFQPDATTEYSYPRTILNGEYHIEQVRDLTVGLDTSQPDGKAVLPTSASSQMITFSFTNGFVITLRTSGTEPKIKYYAELCGKPEDKDRAQLRATLERMCDAIVEEFLQPEQNKLTPKVD